MSILNRPNDGLFNVLIVLYETICKAQKIDRDELIKTCAPGSLDKKMVQQTLNRWTQLGLFQSSNSDKISFTEEYQIEKKRSTQGLLTRLPGVLRKIIFSEQNNQNFWESERSFSADFTRGISWLLAQDVYTFNTQNHQALEQCEFSQIANANMRLLQNDVRWAGLKEWSIYLGFGWEADNLIIDPTIAVREVLPEVFVQSDSLPINLFVQKLAEILPVLDLGKYRLKVEAELNKKFWKQPEAKHISTSLGRTLKRLDLSRDIYLEQRSDALDAYFISGREGKSWGNPITHVILPKKRG